MSMKLSYRDKVIIIVVSVLVILGVGIFCFAKPKYENLQVAKERLAAKEDEQAQVDAKIGTLEGLKKTLEDNVNSIVEDQEQFLSEKEYGDTYLISKYLMDKFSGEKFNITGVNLSPIEKTTLGAYFYYKNAVAYPLKMNADIANKLPPEVQYRADLSFPDPPAGVDIGGTVATVSYECDNDEDLLNVVDIIGENDKNIYLLNFSGSYNEEDLEEGAPKFSGDLVIAVYEIYPLDPEDIDAVPAVLTTATEDEAAAQ